MNESNFNLKTIENSPSNQNQAKDSSQKRFTDNQNLSPDAIGNFSEKPSYSRSSLSSHHGLISPIRQMPDLHQKSKSKALPIYNPNTADNSKRVPINPAHKHANPSFEPSAVTRSEIVQIKLVFDPPIVGTKMKAGIDVITDSGKLEHQEDFYDCDVKWFRGIKRICCVKNCAKSAEVQCITCVKLRISQYNSYFCSLEHLEVFEIIKVALAFAQANTRRPAQKVNADEISAMERARRRL
ncbi:hypothetical protein MHBO_001139 [Bonamia ostreae]|uniref:Uncharacterized protein n=1 Tax=Bonamia ostreae TaxID=126728 RepID=A0ABV2AHW6_9EUKA